MALALETGQMCKRSWICLMCSEDHGRVTAGYNSIYQGTSVTLTFILTFGQPILSQEITWKIRTIGNTDISIPVR